MPHKASFMNEPSFINADKSGIGEVFVQDSLDRTVKDKLINPTSSERGIADKLNRAQGVIREARTLVGEQGGELPDRASTLSARYGYKLGKYSLNNIKSISQKVERYTKNKDIKSGDTKKLSKPKPGIPKKSNTIAGIKKSGKSAKAGKVAKKTSKKVAKAATKAASTAAKIAAAAGKKVASNPLVIKGIAIVIALILGISIWAGIITAVVSIVPTITLKSDNKELSRTYEYITKLDAEMTYVIRNIPKSDDVNEVRYFVNGSAVDNVTIYTDADIVLVYLDCKYDDYAFNKFIYGLFGGTNVKDEITAIHKIMYSYKTSTTSRDVIYVDQDTGKEVKKTVTSLDITVSAKKFEDCLREYNALTDEDIERFDALMQTGTYTTKIELGSPFIGTEYAISSRWGWRISPINGSVSMHRGVDIPMPNGTPINSVMVGDVIDVDYSPDGYGNYVIVRWGKRTVLYAHMSSVAVREGDYVNRGDVIGYVGSTGASTGDHLHLEYTIENGFNTNPEFFLDNKAEL